MGVKSLTSYLEYRSKQYFEFYQVHDCNLVIDGSSLCFNLYNWEYSYWKTGYLYDCYGGDYDKFAKIIIGFFEMLKSCNINPLIVFGGLNGIDRVSVIKKRLEDKVKAAREITPNDIRNKMKMDQNRRRKWPNQNLAVGAVGLKYVFREVVNELNLKSFTCDEEPNQEIASLAQYLDCPVLSANSDFFVLGSLFIPFSSLSCRTEVKKGRYRQAEKTLYKFIQCKMYKIENLLTALNKRPNNIFIPFLLPILLGNDYIDSEAFEPFFRSVNIDGSRQKKIDGIFQWIRTHNTLESALKEIAYSFHNPEERDIVSKHINRALAGYSLVSVDLLLEHLNIDDYRKSHSKNKNLERPHGSNSEKKNVGTKGKSDSEIFMQRLRKCRYPSFFMDILQNNRYLLLNNIEDLTKPDANSIGYTIMAAIHNILVQNDEKQLTVMRRNDNDITVEEYTLPPFRDQLPSIKEIDSLLLEGRRDIFLNILEIHQSFYEIFERLSKEWHVFLITLKYSMSNCQSDFHSSFVYSLLFCFIILNYIDSNLKGFYRTVRDFQNVHKINEAEVSPTEKNLFPKISKRDSFIFMEKCVKYFEMDEEDNTETYNREIMHSIAEFQCVLLHLKYLNNLLDFPFEDALIYKTFDGTFIYNLTKNLMDKPNLKDYLNLFLQDCPTIQIGFFYVVELLEEHSIL